MTGPHADDDVVKIASVTDGVVGSRRRRRGERPVTVRPTRSLMAPGSR
ncbi:hypothetical protein [Streptomyces humidus]